MKKCILAIVAALATAATVAPASAQAVWFGGPGFGVGLGVGPSYGYGPYYGADWAGPTWSPTWRPHYGYWPRVGYPAYGYPVSYGYSSDWYGADVALETYAVPSIRTYAFAPDGYDEPRALRYRSVRSYAFAPARSRHTRVAARSYAYAPRVGYASDRYRTSSFTRAAVRQRGSLHTADRTGIRGAAEFGNSRGSLRSTAVRMHRGSATSFRSGPASQARVGRMNGRMR
jgi:hypothetical protein